MEGRGYQRFLRGSHKKDRLTETLKTEHPPPEERSQRAVTVQYAATATCNLQPLTCMWLRPNQDEHVLNTDHVWKV